MLQISQYRRFLFPSYLRPNSTRTAAPRLNACSHRGLEFTIFCLKGSKDLHCTLRIITSRFESLCFQGAHRSGLSTSGSGSRRRKTMVGIVFSFLFFSVSAFIIFSFPSFPFSFCLFVPLQCLVCLACVPIALTFICRHC